MLHREVPRSPFRLRRTLAAAAVAVVLGGLGATSLGCAAGDPQAPALDRADAGAPGEGGSADGARDGTGNDATFDVGDRDAVPSLTCTRLDFFAAEDPGADGLWATSDDHVVHHAAGLLDAQARLATSIQFDAPGPDGIWGTEDDVVQTEDAYEYAAAADTFPASRTEHQSAGPDGVWLSADDKIGVVERYVIEPGGTLRGSIDYLRDAPVAGTTCKTPAGAKLPREYLFASDPGPDRVFLTSDDVFLRRVEQQFDALGRRSLVIDFSGPGPDHVWGNDDDVISSALLYDCARKAYRTARDPGADGVWGTADDTIAGATRLITTPDSCGGYDLCTSAIR